LKINRDKLFFRHVLLHYFDLKKTAAEAHRSLSKIYGDETPSERTCRVWFERFRKGDFDVRNKERPAEKIKRFRAARINENPAQTLLGLSKALKVIPKAVSKRLHAIGSIIRQSFSSLSINETRYMKYSLVAMEETSFTFHSFILSIAYSSRINILDLLIDQATINVWKHLRDIAACHESTRQFESSRIRRDSSRAQSLLSRPPPFNSFMHSQAAK